MGQRIRLSCDSCGCKKEMSVGAGLMSNQPNIIANCLDQEEAERWKALYGQNKIDSYQPGQKAYYCDNCKELVCQLTVDATLIDGSTITFGNKCKACHNELQEISLKVKHIVCPICKHGDLTWQQIGLWD